MNLFKNSSRGMFYLLQVESTTILLKDIVSIINNNYLVISKFGDDDSFKKFQRAVLFLDNFLLEHNVPSYKNACSILNKTSGDVCTIVNLEKNMFKPKITECLNDIINFFTIVLKNIIDGGVVNQSFNKIYNIHKKHHSNSSHILEEIETLINAASMISEQDIKTIKSFSKLESMPEYSNTLIIEKLHLINELYPSINTVLLLTGAVINITRDREFTQNDLSIMTSIIISVKNHFNP